MIEISHNQARRLIRDSLDDEPSRRVSTEQWASLQLHLENCAECRAYQEDLYRVQKGLSRALHQRWDAGRTLTIYGKGQAVMHDVNLIRESRKQRKKMALYAIGGAFALFFILLWRGYQVATAPPPTPTPAPTEFGATATATPVRFAFHGVVAFHAPGENGAGEIYLFNSGFGPEGSGAENLTNHPANDIFPSWSPDGEWLAFLSNRGAPASRPDKLDLYVMHISGSQLTRLTNDPDVSFQGPITWQLDGAWLGLIGHHWSDSERERFVYLVPVNAAVQGDGGARALGTTMGAVGPVRFSPGELFLAFRIMTGSGGEVLVFDRGYGRFLRVTWEDAQRNRMNVGDRGHYAWSGDGKRLVYLAVGAEGSQIKSTLQLAGDALRQYNSTANPVWENAPPDDLLSAASFSPVVGTNLVAYLQGPEFGEEEESCATLHIRDQPGRAETAAALTVPNLCIQQGVYPENWIVQDDPWIVVTARPREEGTPGLYAIRVLPDLSRVAVERLADLIEPGADVPEDRTLPYMTTPGWMHARPSGLPLRIRPRAVRDLDFQESDPALGQGFDRSGRLVFRVWQPRDPDMIVSTNPDGTGRLVLTAPSEDSRCPAVSPDGQTIAYLSNRESRDPSMQEIFLMDEIGQNRRRLTQVQTFYPITTLGEGVNERTYPHFDCPVWSPDGMRVAAVLRTGGSTLLVVASAEGEAETYYPIQPVSTSTPPLWLNEDEIALVYTGQEGESSARIVAVDLASARGNLLAARTLAAAGEWQDVYGMLAAPPFPATNHLTLAYFAAGYRSFEGTILTLHITDLENRDELSPATLPSSLLRDSIGINRPFLLPDGQIGFFQRFPYDAAVKTRIMVYDPNTRILQTAAELPDIVYDYAQSPYGTSVVFSSETGLYVIDLTGAPNDDIVPVQLAEMNVYEVDWR